MKCEKRKKKQKQKYTFMEFKSVYKCILKSLNSKISWIMQQFAAAEKLQTGKNKAIIAVIYDKWRAMFVIYIKHFLGKYFYFHSLKTRTHVASCGLMSKCVNDLRVRAPEKWKSGEY
jgi:predicted component of type VI protein secretion system